MKRIADVSCAFALVAALSCTSTYLIAAETVRPATRPNILLIYSDDHGWADLGLQGVDQDIRTPHLDQLVQDGVRFTRGYVTAPQCVPSRAGVITGRYQQRFGVEDNTKGPLPLGELTIAERLKSAGYISGWVGKSHLDISSQRGVDKNSRIQLDHLPHHQGFEEYFRGEMRDYYASHGLDGKPFLDAPKLVHDTRFRVEVQTEAALSFLDRRAANPRQPWFLYLAWYAPHVPLESPEPWFSQTPATLPKERRQALAMIAAMDDGLGRIRSKLKAMGVDQNTLIFFIGDNGAPLKEGAWNGSLNLPLIGEKGMLTDGGVRVPFVAAWPGTIPAGQVYEHPVSSLDVAATAVALGDHPQDANLDGVNLIPYLTDENNDTPHGALFWRWRSQAAVLEFPWKLIQLGEHERYLFNVSTPEGELKNLLTDHADIATRLEAKLQTWSESLKPPGPPEPNNDQDNMFFAAHVDKTIAKATKRREGSAVSKTDLAAQGWLCRNGTLAVKNSTMILTPAANSKANQRLFVTNAQLDLPGPVTAVLKVRGLQVADSSANITWRTKAESFAPHQSTTFDWPTNEEWQEVRVTLSETSRIIHIRIHPPRDASSIQIQSVELHGKDGEPCTFRFDTK
ncbi:MAG: sulfatase-like hydrolase/transferase [bacterium]|nr:sulfatase-like hydrolase/transferase [bacterium]